MIKNKMIYEIIIMILIVINTSLSIIGFIYHKNMTLVDNGFFLNGEESITLEYGSQYEEAGFVASINKESFTKDVVVESDLNINKLGEYEIKYTLEYKNYQKTLVRKVKISDNTFPTLVLKKCDVNQYVALKGKLKECKISASDNYDGDISDKVVTDSNVNLKKVGDYQITYSISDSNHNKVSKTVHVHVREKDDITYIKVSISKQKLEYYENNKIVLSTPITSGRNNNTKTGNFRILNMQKNATLKGPGYVSFVQYWMGYGGGYGLHDASWRRVFGTQDYKWNGSHGCINMPTTAAKKLYGMVEVGTPLYIKY